ncbi:MAG: hypothetical protein ACI8QZ_002646 [Chlamydiales bacterium]
MKATLITWILLCVSLAGRAGAQDEKAHERVDLRVTATGPNVVVDRGSNDLLEVGDLVLFRARGGNISEGTVIEASERSAIVELLDKAVVLAVGTRGAAMIPALRLVPVVPGVPAGQVTGEQWENADEGWTPNMPLLAEIRAVRPERRDRAISGRLYFVADSTHTSQQGRSDTFMRVGESLRIENPFERGGGVQIDLEQNYRATDLPDQFDEDSLRMRFDRVSYYRGGGRFSRTRWEAGRFLQDGVAEFGLLDGFEYSKRLDSGDSVGGSVGYMPEPFDHLNSGRDFQAAGYYRWVADASERLTATGGFQQTLHNSAADRSLLVGKLEFLPDDGWNFLGAVWVDAYSASDTGKGSGLGLTQAYMSTTRRYESGSGMNVTYTHWEFPELQRDEGFQALPEQIADAHNDRVSFRGWKQLTSNQRTHTELGVWGDQEESGGDAAAGVTFTDMFGDRTRTDLTVFGTQARFSALVGGRVVHGKSVRNGRWDVLYEAAQNDQHGFAADTDNIIQYRLRGSRTLTWASGWDLSVYAESFLWADEDSWSLGLYLQRSF